MIFHYRLRYYLIRPWLPFKEIYNELKWVWQRIYRGWDDRVVWSIDGYLCQMMPQWLEKLNKDKHGVPISMFNPEDGPDYTNEQQYEAQMKWLDTVNEIIDGFKAANRIIENNWEVYEELDQIFKEKCGNVEPLIWGDNSLIWHEEYKKLEKELNIKEKLEKEIEEAHKKWERGADLFKIHFFSLWD